MGISKYFKGEYEWFQVTREKNAIGELVKVRESKGLIEGVMRNMKGDQKIEANSELYTGTHRFYTLETGPTIHDEIEFNGDIYRIRNVNNVMLRNSHYQIDCELVK